MGENIWAVCFEDQGVLTYAVESYDTEAEAAARAEQLNEELAAEPYFAAELEPDALGDYDRWAMEHSGRAIRIS